MNLISCNECGVVLDKNKLIFPDIYDPNTGDLLPDDAQWDGMEYVAKITCPVCGGVILDSQ